MKNDYYCSCKDVKPKHKKVNDVTFRPTIVDNEGICYHCGYYAHYGKPKIYNKTFRRTKNSEKKTGKKIDKVPMEEKCYKINFFAMSNSNVAYDDSEHF